MEDASKWLLYPVCGVYALWAGEICIYVGGSANIAKRLKYHVKRMQRSDKFHFNRVTVHICEIEDLDRLETAYILELKPKFNQKLETDGIEVP